MRLLLLFLILLPVFSFAQKREVFHIDSLPKEGILLNQDWKWHAGDNFEWAKPEFDDAAWQSINPTLDIVDSLPQIPRPSGIFWLRLQLKLNRQWLKKHLAFQVLQSGASEIYLNGRLIKRLGKVSANPNEISAFDPLMEPIPFHLDTDSNIVLSIRYTLQPNLKYTLSIQRQNPAFKAQVNTLETAQIQIDSFRMRFFHTLVFMIGALLILLICYASFYLYYPLQKSNLFFSLFALFEIVCDLLSFKVHLINKVDQFFNFFFGTLFFFELGVFFLLTGIYSLLNQKRSWIYWTLFLFFLLSTYIQAETYHYATATSLIIINLMNAEIVHITLKSIKIKKRGSWIIAAGGISFMLFWSIFILGFVFHFINNPLFGTIYVVGDFSYNLSLLSIPIAVTIYFGLDIAVTNRSLQQKLVELEFLSAEKNQILQTQNETLETQVAERTIELSTKNRELEIEAALERVRSQAMSMQKSNELAGIIRLINQELGKLDTNLDRSFIMLLDANEGGATWWMASSVEPSLLQGYQIPYHDHPPHIACLEAWKKQVTRWEYINTGIEKKQWDEFLFNHTELSQLPKFIISNMRGLETAYLSASFNKYGCILTGSFIPLEPISMDLIVRFSYMFEQTYTRFLDLQKAEEQAEQARLNLIQIQTEKKRAEDALIALKQTQAQLIQSEKLASLGELTAGIAHEIQNPLNFVNNFAEVSAELLDDMKADLKAGKTFEAAEIADDLQVNLQKINHHGQRASAIVKGMLEHSCGRDAIHRVSTDINALADEYLRLAYHGLRVKDSSFNATMETHFDPDLPKIEVIPQDIGRVLLNLINNAFYAVNQRNNAVETLQATSLQFQPTVTITTRKLENAIEISIKDNGNGIPEAIKDKIFQPFFTTKPTGQGTGLGLSLAYDIVTKGHGGNVKVVSLPSEGSEFIINLPV